MSSRRSQYNLDLIRRMLDGTLAKENINAYEQMFSEDVVIHGSGQEVQGLAAAKQLDSALTQGFTKQSMEVHDMFAGDDRVVVYWTLRAYYRGEYEDLAARNKEATVRGISIYRITKGKISEVWQGWDHLGLLEQIAEVSIRPSPIDPKSKENLITALGMDKYLKKASRLSKRERECLKYLLEGKTAKDTAATLSISYRTVESYFENIKTKLDCWSKRELFTTAQIMQKLELL